MHFYLLLCIIIISIVSCEPRIHVQCTFVESWKSNVNQTFSTISGHTIVISVESPDPSTGVIIPYQGYVSILIQSQNLSILLSSPNGFESKTLIGKEIYEFPLNQMGRFSFTVPVQNEDGSWNMHLPEILIRTFEMPQDNWYFF